MNSSENQSQSVDKPAESETKTKSKKSEREEGEIDDEEDEYEHYSDEEETKGPKTKEVPKVDNLGQGPNQDSFDDDEDELGLSNKRLKIDEGEEQAQETKNLEQDADFSSASSAVSAFSTSSVKTELSAISSTSLPLSGHSQKSDEDSKAQKNADKLKVPPLKIICSNPNGGLPYIKSQDAKSEANHVSTRSKSALKTNRTASPIPNAKTTPSRRNAMGRSSPSVKLRSSSPSSDSSTMCVANADSLIKRKLRSHTKQLQNGDGSLQKSSSSSPIDETEEDTKLESKILLVTGQNIADATVTTQTQNCGQAHEQIMGNATANCMKKFYEIRNVVTRQKEALMQPNTRPELPKNINEFLLVKRNYLIRHNSDVKRSIPLLTAPNDMPQELKQLFTKQENERHKLRLRHRIEQDKLVILHEQEVLRCFKKQCKSEMNQTVPLSFCAIIKDAEVYSLYKNELASERQNQIMTPMSPDDTLSNSLNKVKQKFLIFKNDMVKRQLNESDSLFAVQKMDFQSKIRDLSLSYDQLNVPIVNVNNKFDLFDPASQFSIQRVLPSTGSHLVSVVPLTTMFT